MRTYTGWQWLLIDAANHAGMDKLTFEQRIDWAETRLANLEDYAKNADKPALYVKAVMAIRKAQAGQSTGHLVGVDATCSGIQIMSALTGCVAGARATGLIDPDRRADAYTDCTNVMQLILGDDIDTSRADAKRGLMTSFYGSRKTPKDIYGEDSPELKAFYEAAQTIAPGAWELLQDLLKSWQPYALEHSWKLPDGFDVRVKVMQKCSARIEIDELDHASFTYEYYENSGSKSGLSNVANLTHSTDSYILRCMHRRCNYDREMVEQAGKHLMAEFMLRPIIEPVDHPIGKEAAYYIEQYKRSTVADIAILPFITTAVAQAMSSKHIAKLLDIVTTMIQHQPFDLVTVHDELTLGSALQ